MSQRGFELFLSPWRVIDCTRGAPGTRGGARRNARTPSSRRIVSSVVIRSALPFDTVHPQEIHRPHEARKPLRHPRSVRPPSSCLHVNRPPASFVPFSARLRLSTRAILKIYAPQFTQTIIYLADKKNAHQGRDNAHAVQGFHVLGRPTYTNLPLTVTTFPQTSLLSAAGEARFSGARLLDSLVSRIALTLSASLQGRQS